MKKNAMVIVYYVAAFLFMIDACMEFFGGGKVGNGVVWLLLCIVMLIFGFRTSKEDAGVIVVEGQTLVQTEEAIDCVSGAELVDANTAKVSGSAVIICE